MDMEYFDLWYFLSKAWARAYDVYQVTNDMKFLDHGKLCTSCEDIVYQFQFRDKAETGI